MSKSGSPTADQGSIWRRWDPHIHFPGTVLNDQFRITSVADTLELIASRRPLIEAIGVTDYMTTASFRRARDAHRAGAGASVRLLFPNVEVRLDNATHRGAPVNAHLLCRPDDVDLLDAFLGSLEFSWNDNVYRGDHAGLIRLGRDFTGRVDLDETAALEHGVRQFKVNFEAFRKAMRNDRRAREAILIAVAGGEGDGTSGLRSDDGSFTARRQSIESMADAIESGSPQQVAFWLGRGADTRETIERLYRGLKPCLHGSDGHDIDHLGIPFDNRFTWLKGHPTFDTLKLACIAPESRCYIGAEAPTAGYTHGRVIAVTVASDWFVNDTVPINPGLVAIIGARGSGKTALADLIAAGAGSDEPFRNRSSFVSRAGHLLDDSVAAVEWSHEETTTCNIADGWLDQGSLRPVRYLSQQFVERLCSSDGVSDELLDEIKRVVFEAWPVESREGATTFEELLSYRLSASRARQAEELRTVLALSDRVTELRHLQRRRPSIQKERDAQQRTLDGIDKKIEALTSSADRASADRHTVVADVLHRRQTQLQKLGRTVSALQALTSQVSTARTTTFPSYVEELRDKHEDAGLDDVEWQAFAIDFSPQLDALLADKLDTVSRSFNALRGEPNANQGNLDGLSVEQLAERTIAELQTDASRLEKLVGLDEARTKQLRDLTEVRRENQGRVDKLDADLQRADGADPGNLVTRRLQHYRRYFDALLEEETELRSLYQPLDRLLADFGPSVAKLRFGVQRVVDVDAWADSGERLLDLRRDGRFRGTGELGRVARSELCPSWGHGDAEAAARAIGAFTTRYSDDLRKQRPLRTDDEPDALAWDRGISRWIYSTDHITLRYSLEYDGLAIERLSPGLRGIVLLLLYLAVDQEEIDPLIIDQPEENLDPESVYTELVTLFRGASRRRQIIMVTHNANLVVNTDVDQVIVASCGALHEGHLPHLSYMAGGLEDPAIRRAVCEVLEGGAEAFRQRARRLGLELSAPGDVGTDEE